MNFFTKTMLKLNPKYLNKLKEEDLNDEIILYALENGYDYNYDESDKFCKYDSYVIYNLKKDKTFISNYLNSKHFNFSNLSEKIINYLKSNVEILLFFISQNKEFINLLDSKVELNDSQIDKLFESIKFYKISYSELNEEFIKNNYMIGLKYLEYDFSNIVNFRKYNENYKEYSEEILNIFKENIENNIVYLNEIVEFGIDEALQDDIKTAIRTKSILVNENTPDFIYENKFVCYSLIMGDLNNLKYINKEVQFEDYQINAIIDKIKNSDYEFDEIPFVLKKYDKAINAIIEVSPYVIDNVEVEYNGDIIRLIKDNIINGRYKISNNTKNNILNGLLMYGCLNDILKYDFNTFEFFKTVDFPASSDDQKELYNILKSNNFIYDKQYPILNYNIYLIKDALENEMIDIRDINWKTINPYAKSDANINQDESDDFLLFVVNYAIKKGITDIDRINEWKEEINLKNCILRSANVVGDNKKRLYIDNFKLEKISFTDDVKEVFCSDMDVDYINMLIDIIKSSNTKVERIVVDLKNDRNLLKEEVYFIEELEKIKDKSMVCFGSINDQTRISTDDMIKMEKTLDLFVQDIKTSDLSPYERYIAVYNIVKTFKDYRYYKDDKTMNHDYYDQSRNIYLILNNDYIVCVGYARLLETLLRRVGIDSVVWNVVADEGHARNYVHLVDPKYNIDGYYMCDPTWDKTHPGMMNRNGFNYLHQTTEEARNDIQMPKEGDLYDYIFDDYTDEEMLDKLKDDSKGNSRVGELKFYDYLLTKIKYLDPELYKEIEGKEITLELASLINSRFKEKVNNPIPRVERYKAMFEINCFIEGKKYTGEEYKEKWDDYIVGTPYEKDMLFEDKEKDIALCYEELKNMTYSDYYNMEKVRRYKKNCFYIAQERLFKEYLDDSKLFLKPDRVIFQINVDLKIMENGKYSEIYDKLKEKGYNLDSPDNFSYIIKLDSSCFNMNIVELLEYGQSIKNDYLEVYNSVLGNNFDMN